MSVAISEAQPWSRRRWWGMVVLVFVAQLGLIFWLADRAPFTTHASAPAPEIRLAGKNLSEVLALEDPTLFALPHRRGFSGLAWLSAPVQPSQYFHWSESPRWLPTAVSQFGTIFGRVMETNDLRSAVIFERPLAEFSMSQGARSTMGSCQSTMRLEGGVVGRNVTTPVVLTPQASGDLLTNSVVQVVVDAGGEVVSVPVLLARSGSADADREALRIAGTLRFNSVKASGPAKAAVPPPSLSWGQLVFEWCTIPLPGTNTPSGP